MAELLDQTSLDTIIVKYTQNVNVKGLTSRLNSLEKRGILPDMCKVKFHINYELNGFKPKIHRRYKYVKENHYTFINDEIIELTLFEYITYKFGNNKKLVELLLKYSDISNVVIEHIFKHNMESTYELITNYIIEKYGSLNDFNWDFIINRLKSVKYQKNIVEHLSYLVSKGLDINHTHDDKTLLRQACEYFGNDTELIQFILENEGNVYEGEPLAYLVQSRPYNLLNLMKMFINYGYDMNHEMTNILHTPITIKELVLEHINADSSFSTDLVEYVCGFQKDQQTHTIYTNTSCPVCYDEYNDNCVAILECGHCICSGCCDMCESSCPVCRTKFTNIINLKFS